jgi:hypothetical protein
MPRIVGNNFGAASSFNGRESNDEPDDPLPQQPARLALVVACPHAGRGRHALKKRLQSPEKARVPRGPFLLPKKSFPRLH